MEDTICGVCRSLARPKRIERLRGECRRGGSVLRRREKSAIHLGRIAELCFAQKLLLAGSHGIVAARCMLHDGRTMLIPGLRRSVQISYTRHSRRAAHIRERRIGRSAGV
eukprot:scaffold1770_cov129-Isochrysis_galbana.AAC.3